MKSKHLILIAVVMIMVAGAFKVYGGTMVLETKYPAPTGYYQSLTVQNLLVPQNGRIQIPCYRSGHTGLLHEIWVENDLCPS